VGGRLHTVEIECPVGERQHRGADDRRILGAAAGHHHVDGEYLAGQRAPARRHFAFDELRVAAERSHDRVDLFLGGRDDGKSVRPSAFVVKFDEIRVGRYPLDGGRADLFQCLKCHYLAPAVSTRSHPMPNPLYAKEILIAWIDTEFV